MADARFEDGGEQALRLVAMDGQGLEIVAALTQDAVFTCADLTYDRRLRQFGLLINRFRWEDREAAEAQGRPYERVRSALVFEDVLSVRSMGIDRADRDTVLSLLSADFVAGEEGAGTVTLVLAGDGAIELQVETLETSLTDVTRPYIAVSGRMPGHGE